MCAQEQVIGAVRKPLQIYSFPVTQVGPHRKAATLAASRGGKAGLFTETIHATDENGLYVSASAVGGPRQSMIRGVPASGDAALPFIGGALAAIGSAVIPAVVDVGINLIKKVLSAEDLAGLSVAPADIAVMDAVLSVSDPNIGDAPVPVGRYRFDVTPNAILADPAPFTDGFKLTAPAELPPYLQQVALCIAKEAGTELFELAKANLHEIDGITLDALNRFLRAMLAGGGVSMVALIQKAARCL